MDWPDCATGGNLGDGRRATATDRPDSLDALRHAVVARGEAGLAIYPQGGCTALDYGGAPRRPGVALDIRALNQVIDYPAADMTITVQAGITLSALDEILATSNQRLPLDAPQPERATLGGIYATNTSGPRRFGAGRPRDMIIGVSFVIAAGELVKGGGRVVKNVAGYDFPKLLTGSMGTLGILTQMTLKVRPRPESSALAWASFDDDGDLAMTLEHLNTSHTRPIAIEVLNREAAKLLDSTDAPVGDWNLIIGFEDNAASVAWQLDRVSQELAHAREQAQFRDFEAAPLWKALTKLQASEVGSVSFVANLRPSATLPFCSELSAARWAVQCHAGNGIVRAHVLGQLTLEDVAPEIDRLRCEAVGAGGNLVLSRCPTAWKDRLKVWGERRGDWAIAEKVKQAFDPFGVLNPGRFVGTI